MRGTSLWMMRWSLSPEIVEIAVEPGVMDGLERHAEQILQGAVGISAFGDLQFAPVAAKAGDGQDARDQHPWHDLAAWFDYLAQEGVQPEPPPQSQSEKDLAEVAQVDGAHGTTAAIVEMLLQSHAGELHLLLALPKEWVSDLRARGGFTVDREWRHGQLTAVVIHSQAGNPLRVRYQDRVRDVLPATGEAFRWDGN